MKDNYNRSIIEDFSNELFYEIFNYLDGYQIYHIFSNINHRFQQLINSSSLRLKMKYCSNISNEILRFNKEQIYSLSLNESFSINLIDSLFIYLESLRITSINSNELLLFISNLQSLPCLKLLTIKLLQCNIDDSQIYHEIFSLKMLKYFKLSIDNYSSSVRFSSFNPNKQMNHLEYLIIDYQCLFPSITNILSYMPSIHYVSLMKLFYYDSSLETNYPFIWPNLTHLSICLTTWGTMFECIEVLISKIGSKLKVFSFKPYHEIIEYFNASRWENLILKFMPQLNKFYLKYTENVDRILRDRDDEETNDFTRSFWIERKWFLEIELNNQNILFSILPSKKQWFHEENLFKLNQLVISRININKYNYFIQNDINRVLNFTQIYHLEITNENLFIGLLLQITNCLFELRSLKIHSLLLEDDSRDLNLKEISILYSIHLTSQIKKIYLRNLTNIKQIDFLMKFSPYLSFFKIDYLHNLDIPSILRQINHTYLNSLCFYVPTADDKMINNLNKISSLEKLLVNYKIIRQNEHIFFNWNLLE
ncbi:unnamed protein product [Adineta steineri]|uniref:F-box domain-containing protein n=1 Tax=Adineta steineri TaxID=433720 RepID=A0A815QUX0_9BILA|nr:unnamed protein product [Adineta steineri]CAF1466848.1 unnamed protein product [Adineta steineri]